MHHERPLRVIVQPRPRDGSSTLNPPSPVDLDQNAIVSLFHLRQTDAARRLGLSLSSLKVACRRIGINKWPYNRGGEHVQAARKAERSSDNNSDLSKEDEGVNESESRGRDWMEMRMQELMDEGLLHVSGLLSVSEGRLKRNAKLNISATRE
ncbi:hypothetical protein GUITHDRAFT_118406 [Guillardia theta CCMP2712]|uniref:RWP-RK domain-containing protein n=1 Tax=Guillardia theta (strain CCMP2712) TaxID=905079 RepID=L1IHV0_GUITC|nr:hypothetical protein GUITHDRAFT_118406 [Guillardia theta CCMP2712]EKX35385.1 hypothetical protein GUITHDRAFT_118406 [Guillardia theta CCMP2712]|eukprot:XP_005822365.1 hypothetical protein GUITHDRAFT_118406 [Guillardia theta CCMP2712]